MGQLVPVGAPPSVGSDEVGVLELAEDLGPGPVARALVHLRPEALLGDQALVEPGAERPLGHAGGRGDGLDRADVELGQGVVDVADGGDVAGLDGGGVSRQRRPQLAAHHLQLDRLDVRPELVAHRRPPLHPHAAQVVDQAGGGLRREVDTGVLGRAPRRGLRRLGPEQVESVAEAQPLGDEGEVGVELGDEVLSHREQRPPPAVAQGDAEGLQELGLLVEVGGVEGEQLLELVEEQARVEPRWQVGAEPLEVGLEVDGGQLGVAQPLPGRPSFLQGQDRAQHVAVGDGAVDRCRGLVADADGWQRRRSRGTRARAAARPRAATSSPHPRASTAARSARRRWRRAARGSPGRGRRSRSP